MGKPERDGWTVRRTVVVILILVCSDPSPFHTSLGDLRYHFYLTLKRMQEVGSCGENLSWQLLERWRQNSQFGKVTEILSQNKK